MLKVGRENKQANRQGYNNIRDDYYRECDDYYNTFDYDTIDLNDEYDYDTRYDVDFAYDCYAFDEVPEKYVEPATEPRYSSFREYSKEDGKLRTQKKKRKMTTGMKALVVVYFAIVAVIASLLIVNALPMMSTSGADLDVHGMENVQSVNVDSNAINNVVMANGTIVTIAAAEAKPYEYTINTNWFDKMCDWMENIAA